MKRLQNFYFYQLLELYIIRKKRFKKDYQKDSCQTLNEFRPNLLLIN
jgi:hypothetical protein